MRIPIAMLLLGVWAQTVLGHQVAKLDQVIVDELSVADTARLDPCEINIVIEEMVRRAGLLAGIENQKQCYPRRSWWSAGAAKRNRGKLLIGMTWREAFDYVLSSTPFRWEENDNVVIVRPHAAWTDPSDVLNLSAGSFTVSGSLAESILPRLLKSVNPSLLVPYTRVGGFGSSIDKRLSVKFPGGTLLEALNTSIRVHGAAAWALAYPTSDRKALLFVYSLEAPNQIVAPPLALPVAK